MNFIAGVDPLKYLESVAKPGLAGTVKRTDAVSNFAAIFYSELVKQAFREQLWATENSEDSLIGNLTPMTDIFADKLAGELVKSGKYDELIIKGLLVKGDSKWL